MKQFYTYLHCKPDGTPFYVGKGSGNRTTNFRTRNKKHKEIVSKYGEKNIGVFVFYCDSEEQAFSDEIQQIAQLRREGYELVNICDGGQGSSGAVRTDENKKLLSEKLTGRKFSSESRLKMSLAKKGKPLSEDHKKKLSDVSKGKRPSVAAFNAAVKARTGMKHTEESKRKISAALKGKIPWNKKLNITSPPASASPEPQQTSPAGSQGVNP